MMKYFPCALDFRQSNKSFVEYFLNIIGNGNDLGNTLEIFTQLRGGKSTQEKKNKHTKYP